MLDISKGKVTLVLVPWDLRAGYYKLAQTAKFTLHIDVEKGKDWVIFISKHRNFAKIIHSDASNLQIFTPLKKPSLDPTIMPCLSKAQAGTLREQVS